ncbi:hypothetical protein [Vibrio spartinae]|uniref:Uncharacterized protein n=1 Tax=Vibrio spartinae TaxID=1918945 RepID=A0A1N6M2X9_9VIBR|nr:hypothetical protein [Vibrio spartinae]SIO93765.1 hypothetical protein VSP9026_01435 [Vibrio spartinae]
MNVTLTESKVQSYQAVTPTTVRIELDNSQTVLLRLSEPWILNQGDLVAIAGFQDHQSNVLIGYGYINLSQHVKSIGRSHGGPFFLFGALLSIITLGIIAFIFSGEGMIAFSDILTTLPLAVVLLFSGFFIWIGVKAKRKERYVKRMLEQVEMKDSHESRRLEQSI